MRSKSEVENGELLIAFLQTDLPKTELIVASPAILADTVRLLWLTISLLDKDLLLKAVFNWVQRSQRVQYLAQALAEIRTRNMPEGTEAQREQKAERKLALVAELNRPLSLYLESQKPDQGHGLLQTAIGVYEEGVKRSQPDIALDRMISLEEFQTLEQQATQFLATEDVFVAACLFLQVEISKDRSMLFIKGESPSFKVSKREREPIFLGELPYSTDAAKKISHSLSRPDSDRGEVEQNYITAAFNHLVKINKYYSQIKAVAAYLNEDANRTKRDAMQFFGITNIDFERITLLARRAGILTWRVKRRTPNSYPINTEEQEFLTWYAKKMKITEPKALNMIISRFANLVRMQEEKEKRISPRKALAQFNRQEQVKQNEPAVSDQQAVPARKTVRVRQGAFS
ncbi:MAG: hypothetical protein LBE22_06830 [Azoarcus sp.]|nr:hypothetical protein [Azoarcus sp.]